MDHRASIHDVRRNVATRAARRTAGSDDGFTLVELLVAFAAMIVLFTIAATAITTYLSVSNTVLGSYSTNDQILPTSIIIQRLIRSEVEPAPTPTASNQVSSPMCPVLKAPCPPFVLGNVGTTSMQFYANVGATVVNGTTYGPGPALIVMSSTLPSKCATCMFTTSTFTVTEQPANVGTCPFSTASTLHCAYGTAPVTKLVNLTNVVNGQTGLLNPSVPIFTYNTLDPYSAAFVPGDTRFLVADCQQPTITTINNVPTLTASNCPADNIQSVGVDLQVLQPGTHTENYQESSFQVYRLSSSSYLYRANLG